MKTFYPDLKERRRILNLVRFENKGWKPRIAWAVILFLSAVSFFLVTIIVSCIQVDDILTIFLAAVGGGVLALIPYFCGLSVKNTAMYKCGLPYSEYANGTLILKGDTLEYIFWRVGRHEPAAYSSKRAVYNDADKYVFTINKKDIQNVSKSEVEICSIIGDGSIIQPDWACRTKKDKIQPQKDFSFALAFSEPNAFEEIEKWIKSENL